MGVQAARPNTLPQQANPAEDATSCCCTRELCVRGARPAVHTVQSGSKAARLSAASHWLGIVAEARTVKRLHAWDLLPPGFRALFVLLASAVVMVIVWQTMNVQLRCPFTLSGDVSLSNQPDAPLKFDFCK